MSRVAVSYRPEDSRDVAARLCDRLTEAFGAARVVRGTTLLEPISGSDVVVVIIGQGWLTPVDADGRRRIDDPADHIRIQVERGLAAGAMVIPALLGGTQMPRPEQLPPSLAQLSFQNGLQLRPDPDFHKDVARLLNAIRNRPLPGTPGSGRGNLPALLASGRNGALAGALLALVFWVFWFEINPTFSAARAPDLVSLGLWPLGWLVVWWRSRRTRERCWHVSCSHFCRRPSPCPGC